MVWGGLAVVAAVIVAAFVATQSAGKSLPVYADIPDFTLTNQNGQTISAADLRGQPWIADVIFTRCPGQCLILSGHMKELQASSPVRLVSFTTDAAFDLPPVLTKYAERFGAESNRWLFLTGQKKALRSVEVDGLKLAVLDKPAAQQEGINDFFIHSDKFVLIDKDGRIRGYFDGETTNAVSDVEAALRTLARE